MTYSAPVFAPPADHGGYPAIEDHGLIGDGQTAALVARDGTVDWLCVPRFDAAPVFCSIVDAARGGRLVMAPEDLVESRQRYEPDSGVLTTELRGATGLVRLTDALALRRGADLAEDAGAARGELVRSAAVLDGRVRLVVDVQPRGDAEVTGCRDGLRLRLAPPAPELRLWATQRLDGPRTVVELRSGDRFDLVLSWSGHARRPGGDVPALLSHTLDAWRRWMRRVHYDGPGEPLVRRSAITLKLLDHFANGAIVAAPTSSLPEAIGGPRNWDYRYTWVRDAAFSVYALRRVGLGDEAWGFLGWVLDAIEGAGGPMVLYDLDGNQPPPERSDPHLEGYRRSAPVRWGNAAAGQRQHDAYGELVDCVYQWAAGGGTIDEALWRHVQGLANAAAAEWSQPDHGIWEVRTTGRVFTYSAAMCQVALDRAARLAERLGLPGDTDRWRTEANRIREAILHEAWDPEAQALTEHLGRGGLDASLLALPLRRVVRADHPRMVATTEAVARRLGAGNGLLYRYLPDESPDGLPGHEGAFLLCSFWLVDNLAYQGRMDEALDLFESLCALAGPLGLLPEQIDPTSRAFLGNYPQAFSHVGLISSGINLARLGGT